MGAISDFRANLVRQAKGGFGGWYRVDLHNHTPSSFDYAGNASTAAVDSADEIAKKDIAIAMFTDHGALPSGEFIHDVAKRSKRTVLRGVELNVFVDAWDKPNSKVGKNLFFHLLIGFSPDVDAEYYLKRIYDDCKKEERDSGGHKVLGVSKGLDEVLQITKAANAIAIPAHLHSNRDAFKSRSLDDIYNDESFLKHVPFLSALEVTDPATAKFFDGTKPETNFLRKACIQSSDSHEATGLGIRPSWAQMEAPSFDALKAALEMPERISLLPPPTPEAYVVGMHVQGQFLKDLWLPLSPHCNVFIGVKGSGKTAALECLRFALGAPVPAKSLEQVNAHLAYVLGPAGKVSVLLSRADGSSILCSRTLANPRAFEVIFEDDRREILTSPEALRFPAEILGWHEIEHAATDTSVRRRYMDAIAGQAEIQRFQDQALEAGQEIKYRHEQAAGKYGEFRQLDKKVKDKEELRRGLKTLEDANLIVLRDDLERAESHRQAVTQVVDELRNSPSKAASIAPAILNISENALAGSSPLEQQVDRVRKELALQLKRINEFGVAYGEETKARLLELLPVTTDLETKFADFLRSFEEKVALLTDDQRKLLNSHREVLNQTRELPALAAERDKARGDVERLLRELIDRCDRVVAAYRKRSDLRKEKVEAFGERIGSGIRLEFRPAVTADEFDFDQGQHRAGWDLVQKIRGIATLQGTFHMRLKALYESLAQDLAKSESLVFESPELSLYVTRLENDDMAVFFDTEGSGKEFRAIDKLSAGQRCTAMFPIVLGLKNGPLVIDQPEDNLDNRHIASKVAPILMQEKKRRQIILTSHNANLVVMSDAENIVAFEGHGSAGEIVTQGFSESRSSPITSAVLDILDGGQVALEMRYRKYGATST